jgi:hypothetical protein
LAIEKYKNTRDVLVIYNPVKNEHQDNARFLKDCEKWLGVKIQQLRSDKFVSMSIFEVFRSKQFIADRHGASCTTHLKRNLAKQFRDDNDINVYGYTIEEQKRIDQFEDNNPLVTCDWILSDNNITKHDCLNMIKSVGIELPVMYRLGYKNNNCIGCVKGGAGYWNKIRKDFPKHFKRMAQVSRKLGVKLIKTAKTGRIFLDELPEGVGNYKAEKDISCGPHCSPPKHITT